MLVRAALFWKVEQGMSLALDMLPKCRLAGFGRSNWSECRVATGENVDELRQLFARCRDDRVQLAFRGSGRSYGDAFVPETASRLVFREVLARSRAAGLPAYLGVMNFTACEN